MNVFLTRFAKTTGAVPRQSVRKEGAELPNADPAVTDRSVVASGPPQAPGHQQSAKAGAPDVTGASLHTTFVGNDDPPNCGSEAVQDQIRCWSILTTH